MNAGSSSGRSLSRRQLLQTGSLAAAASVLSSCDQPNAEELPKKEAPFKGIVDVHQHPSYLDRPDAQLIDHQKAMGITKTILLPAASVVDRPSTHNGKSNGLAARISGNESCLELTKKHPDTFAFFANEVPDLPNARKELERYLKAGAIGIGEQKFAVDCDSQSIEVIASLARDYDVPVLLHFEHNRYNLKIERFHRILEKFPTVTFIGHAQTWWGNIDKNHKQATMYPKGPVTPGGITDRYLADYPNMYGDLSAGSGNNALARDKEHAKEFLRRHHKKLLYGSDCPDRFGQGKSCIGSKTLSLIVELLQDPKKQENILGRNARDILRV